MSSSDDIANANANDISEWPSSLYAPDTAVICAIALNEEPYVHEWIQYHLKLGFDHIYIYDNDDKNPLKRLANKYQGKVTVIHYPGACQQMNAYYEFLHKARGEHTWCAFIDVDEFIVLRNHASIHPFLKKYCKEGALALSWVLFGSNGHKQYEQGPILARFIRRQDGVNRHVKVIVRLSHLEYMSGPHVAKLQVGRTHDCHGRHITYAYNDNPNDDIACIHHYFTKSEGEFLQKCKRGRADIPQKRDFVSDFREHDLNEVVDMRAADFQARK